MSKKKRAIITGSDGQLGTSFKLSKSFKESYETFFFPKYLLDITSDNDLDEVFRDIQPNVLINCAAYNNVDVAEIENHLVYGINHEAVEKLAYNCKKHNTLFVHFSSDYVFPGNKNSPYSIKDLPSPISKYGHSKLLGEQSIQFSDCNYLIIRVSRVFSEHKENFLTKFFNTINKGKNEIFLPDYQISCPTYSNEIVKFVNHALQSQNNFQNLIHFSGNTPLSILAFGALILDEFKKLNSKFKSLQVLPQKNKDSSNQSIIRPANSSLKSTKIINKKFSYEHLDIRSCVSKACGVIYQQRVN